MGSSWPRSRRRAASAWRSTSTWWTERLIRGGGCWPRRSRAAPGTVGGIVELYRYLEAQLVVISATATAARRERRVHGRTWRNSFLLGAVGRVGQRLDARRAE